TGKSQKSKPEPETGKDPITGATEAKIGTEPQIGTGPITRQTPRRFDSINWTCPGIPFVPAAVASADVTEICFLGPLTRTAYKAKADDERLVAVNRRVG